MGKARSAGILLYRVRDEVVEILIGHMGGPFWVRRESAAWSIPKGEIEEGEDGLGVALREFEEEIGQPVPSSVDLVPLGEEKQGSGKVVSAWAGSCDLDVSSAVSNTFSMEWPKGSGVFKEFPELDRIEWVEVGLARDRLIRGQVPFLDKLMVGLSESGATLRETKSHGSNPTLFDTDI